MMHILFYIFYYLEWFILGAIFTAIVFICGTTKYIFTTFVISLGVLGYYFVINANIRNITKSIIIVILFISILPLLIYVSCETASATEGISVWNRLVEEYLQYSNDLESHRERMKTEFSDVTRSDPIKFENKLDCMENMKTCQDNMDSVDNEALKFHGKTVSSELGQEPQMPTSNKRGFEDSSLGPNKR